MTAGDLPDGLLPGERRPGLVRRVRDGAAAVRRATRLRRWSGEASAILVITILLTVLGLVMSFSASFVDAAQSGNEFAIVRRQLMWAVIGGVGFTFAARMPLANFRRLSWLLLPLSLLGLALVLSPLGVERFGSTRWLGIGPMVVQPSEVAKLAVMLWLADVLVRKRPKDGSPHRLDHLYVPAFPVLVVTGALILAEPDLGQTLLLLLIVFLILFVEGMPWKHLGLLAVSGVAFAALMAVIAPYRMARVLGWLDPEADPLGSGFQLLQSLFALASGGIQGVGIGSSRGKWNYIPNPETDFVFAIVGEEMGFIGAMIVLGLFGALLYVGMRVARRARDPFGQVIAFTITGWLVGQALVNISTVIGLLPITGVTLPLVSVGGSSLLTSLVALGLLLSVARNLEPVGPPVDRVRHVDFQRDDVAAVGAP